MPILHVITGNGIIFDYPFTEKQVSLGRSKKNNLPLNDITVSRHHADIRKLDNEYLILDLGSYNGTRLNGKLIQTAPLNFGDKIQVGSTRLTFLGEKGVETGTDESLILTAEDDFGKGEQKIIKSSPRRTFGESSELLASLAPDANLSAQYTAEDSKSGTLDQSGEARLSDLARMNKILFVLYEISRQLSQITDFDQLLRKIMDLIFMVIDADYGFLVLLGGRDGNDLVPVVIKHKESLLKKGKKIKASRTLIRKVIRDKVALLTSNAMADTRLDGAKSLFLQKIKSAMCVPLWRKDNVIGVIELGTARAENHFNQHDLELLKAIGSQMAMVIEQAALNEQIREEERMRNRLERFHSPQVIEMILRGDQKTKDRIMDPKELIATILFMDIVGFTRMSERMPPREITILLNHFFSRMTDIAFHYDGTLDKYIGDGLMVVFGAPMQKEDDAPRAIRAAIDMRKQLGLMMADIPPDRKFDVRIGVNTGKVVAGNIGSPKRMDYTVIGDPVNVASRLESIGEPNQILVGEETYRLTRNRFKVLPVGRKRVKGKRDAVMVYEVVD